MKTETILSGLYFLAVLAVCVGELLTIEPLLWAKVLAMPLLLGWIYASRKGITVLIALILGASWAGDVLLIFAPDPTQTHSLLGIRRAPHFFLMGLGSFLIAQIGYIRAFWRRLLPPPQGAPRWYFWGLALYAVAFTGFLWVRMSAYPEKSGFRLPVAFYAAALTAMAMSVATQRGYLPAQRFREVFAGALLFVLSDSLIGLNYLGMEQPFWGAGALIFLTYGAAQWLLAQGLAQQAQATHSPIHM